MGRRGALTFAAWSPPVFVAIVAVLTALNWSFLTDLGFRMVGESEVPWPSSTALGRLGWLQILNFVQLGLAIAVLAVATRARFDGHAAKVAWVSLGIGALATGALAFPTDPSWEPQTWHGVIHAAAFFLMLVAMLVAVASYSRIPVGALRVWSLGTVLVVVALTAVSFTVVALGAIAGSLALLVLAGWVSATALHLRGRSLPG